MTNYVAGFMFSPDLENVLLIEKKKPEWQKDKYNAIGGKIEGTELPVQAMVREFEEETSLSTSEAQWASLVVIEGKDYRVHFFYTKSNKWDRYISTTEEEVFHIPVLDLHLVRHQLIQNLNWLIHLAIDVETNFSGKITTQ